MGKKWEILFRLEQRTKDKNYRERVKNYEKVIILAKKVHDLLVTEGIPLGFLVVNKEWGIREEKKSPK